MTTDSPVQVHLQTNWFQKALDRYIDDHKPDPLARKQLQEKWSFDWSEEKEEDGKNKMMNINNNSNNDQNETLQDPSHAIEGILEIGGEYLVIVLYV